MGERWRRSVPIAVAGVVLLSALLWLALGSRDPAVAPPSELVRAATPQAPAGPGGVARPRDLADHDPVAGGEAEEAVPAEESGDTGDDQDAMAAAWSVVDFEEVRRAMPDNLYFKLSSPTKDEAVLAERDAERVRWNEQFGKIQSGTATEEEISAYYDLRARLSTDYVEFTTYLLDHYGDQIPERDVGLLELARRMHLTRLQEVPRKVEEAFERKRQQDEARAAWLAGEADFAPPDEESE